MPNPLQGIFVADFSRVLAGPLCTQMLADAGADVVKIEDPRGGDETRRWGPPFLGGFSTYFLSTNRNKRSIALDIKRGGEIARRIIERADVVVDNFLPSQRAAFGFDRIRRWNRRAVHCSITGFDPASAQAGLPGYDLLAQAGAGLMAITGDPAGDPMKTGVAVADVLTAHHAYGAITTALLARGRTGRGARIEISLFGATLASLVNVVQASLALRKEAARHGNAHPSIVPYQLFHASDRPFVVGAGTDRHFRDLCTVIGQPALAGDARYATNALRVRNRASLVEHLEVVFRSRRARTWVTRCAKANVPASLVNGVLEAAESEAGAPFLAAVAHPAAGTYRTVLNPVVFDRSRFRVRRPPPALGQHTAAILRELGYEPAEIRRFGRDGITGRRTTSAAARGRSAE